MGEKVDVFVRAELKWMDFTFDFFEIYNHAKDWIEWRGYRLSEKLYKEIVHPGDRKEFKIVWECEKDIDNYTRYLLKVEWELYAVKNVDAVFHGKQTKAQKGEIDFFVSAYLVLDRENKWEQSPFLKLFKSFYERFVYAGQITRNQNELWTEGWELHDELKAFIELYKYK